jgi:hypothetical protein
MSVRDLREVETRFMFRGLANAALAIGLAIIFRR